MKKIITIILSLCLLGTLLAACGGADSSVPTPASDGGSAEVVSTPEPAGDVTLSVSWWGGDGRHAATQAALDAFTTEYPNITIKTNYGAWTGWEDSMSTAFYSGSAPDMNQVNWNWIFNYDNNGSTFVDLNSLSDYIDLSQFSESALGQCTIDGRLLAIPVSMTGRIFYWNTNTYEAAGLSVPTSYDELMAAGPVFKEKLGDDYYPLVMNEYDRMIFMVWALECQYGKTWVENGELQYTAEEIAGGIQMIMDMEAAHVIPSIQKLTGDGAESLDKNPKWIDGKYGGIFEWDSSAGKFQAAMADSSGFVVGDYLTGFGDYKGGFTKVSLAFAITQTCQNQVEAAQLINFLLNEEAGVTQMASERGIPLSKAGLQICESNGLLAPIVAEANGKVLSWCQFDLDPTFEDAALKATNEGVYWDVMAGVSYGDYTVEDSADILIEGINSVLAAA